MKKIILPIVLSYIVISCNNTNSNLNTNQPQKDNGIITSHNPQTPIKRIEKLSIDTFSIHDLPDSLYGTGCTYSETKKDYANRRFILSFTLGGPNCAAICINHKIIILRSSDIDSKGDYSNKTYTITVQTTEGKQTGDETTESIGKMLVKSKYGDSVGISLYGECGD